MTKPLAGRGEGSRSLRIELGRYIARLRIARGMTQPELAKAVGMTHYTAISAIEVGRNTVPPERYLDFAIALGVNPQQFMREVLELTNPWAAAMLFSKDPRPVFEALKKDLPDRFN